MVQEALIKAAVKTGALGEEECKRISRKFLASNCRRAIRDPAAIVELVEKAIAYWSQCPYLIPGNPDKGTESREVPVVGDRFIKVWERNKAHVMDDCLSDPPDTPMYIKKPNSGG